MIYSKISDNELMAAIAQSNREAFNEFYLRYRDWVYRQLMNQLTSREEVKDLSQEFWMSVWQNASMMKEMKDTKSFLYVVIARQVSDYYRKDSLHEVVSMEDAPEACLKAVVADVESTLAVQEICRIVEQTLARCTPKERCIYRLRRDYSVRETAKMLGISEKSVRNTDRMVKKQVGERVA
jgi:RNA polymerase sigma-70 factor (ECF subfamily)